MLDGHVGHLDRGRRGRELAGGPLQQRQALGDRALLGEQQGVVQREGGAAGDLLDEVAVLVGPVRPLRRALEGQDRHGPVADRQREVQRTGRRDRRAARERVPLPVADRVGRQRLGHAGAGRCLRAHGDAGGAGLALVVHGTGGGARGEADLDEQAHQELEPVDDLGLAVELRADPGEQPLAVGLERPDVDVDAAADPPRRPVLAGQGDGLLHHPVVDAVGAPQPVLDLPAVARRHGLAR